MANNVAAASQRGTATFDLSPSSPSSTSSTSASKARDDDLDYRYNNDDDNDDMPLPFPAALPRTDFLAPNFQPAAYLSALPHRHQTLEDLRSDLRERSASISAELLELVNSNYTAFLSLGSELRGGDERVGDVKVALLGFRRGVEDVKAKVAGRRIDAAWLGEELRETRRGVERGRKMVDVSERLSSLEERLALDSLPSGTRSQGGNKQWDIDDSDYGEDEEDEEGEEEDGKAHGLMASTPAKLSSLARDCSVATALLGRLDQDHPFVIRLEERLTRCRNTLLLDLSHALKEAKTAGPKGHHRMMRYLEIYRVLDAQRDAVKALRGG